MIRLAGAKGIEVVLSAGCLVLSKGKDSRRIDDDGVVKACFSSAVFMRNYLVADHRLTMYSCTLIRLSPSLRLPICLFCLI